MFATRELQTFRASGTFTALALRARVVKVPRPEKSFQLPSCENNYFVTRATRAFLVETAQVLEAEPLGEARDARRDKKPFARVPKVILCVSMLKS